MLAALTDSVIQGWLEMVKEFEPYQIKYSPEFFERLNKMTKINTRIRVKNEIINGVPKVVIRLYDEVFDQGLSAILTVPTELFSMTDEKMTFVNFSDFYSYFKFLKAPKIGYNGVYLLMESLNQELIKYRVSVNQVRKRTYPDHPNTTFNVSFDIPGEILASMEKMSSMMNSKNAEISYHGNGKLEITILADTNSYKKSFNVEVHEEIEPFTWTFLSDVFSRIPFHDEVYKMYISDRSMRLGFNNVNGIKLDIYTVKSMRT